MTEQKKPKDRSLEERKAEVEEKFKELGSAKTKLNNDLDLVREKLGQIVQEELRLQGEFRVISDLIGEKDGK